MKKPDANIGETNSEKSLEDRLPRDQTKQYKDRATDHLYDLLKQVNEKIDSGNNERDMAALRLKKEEIETSIDAVDYHIEGLLGYGAARTRPNIPYENQPVRLPNLVERVKNFEKRAQQSNNVEMQLDLFLANLIDYSLKDDRDTMEMPVFSLSTKPDMEIWKWCSVDGKKEVEVTPSRIGRATMHDKDFVIFLISQVITEVNEGRPAPKRVRFNLNDFFSATNKKINRRKPEAEGNKDTYELAEDALDRLKGTSIKARTKSGGTRRVDSISFIGDWSIVERSPNDGRATVIEVAISDWMQKILEEKSILRISPQYFSLRKPLEKRLYEIARKHVGEQSQWKIGEKELLVKTGSRSGPREFRRMLKAIVESDSIPEYRIAASKNKATNDPAWIFYPKNIANLVYAEKSGDSCE